MFKQNIKQHNIFNIKHLRLAIYTYTGVHGPHYQKISLVGGGGVVPTSIISTAAVKVPHLYHPSSLRYSQSGNHGYCSTSLKRNDLINRLLLKKSQKCVQSDSYWRPVHQQQFFKPIYYNSAGHEVCCPRHGSLQKISKCLN